MKKFLIILISLAVVVLAVYMIMSFIHTDDNQINSVTDTWKVYVNDEHGFSIKYPDTWQIFSGGHDGGEDYLYIAFGDIKRDVVIRSGDSEESAFIKKSYENPLTLDVRGKKYSLTSLGHEDVMWLMFDTFKILE